MTTRLKTTTGAIISTAMLGTLLHISTPVLAQDSDICDPIEEAAPAKAPRKTVKAKSPRKAVAKRAVVRKASLNSKQGVGLKKATKVARAKPKKPLSFADRLRIKARKLMQSALAPKKSKMCRPRSGDQLALLDKLMPEAGGSKAPLGEGAPFRFTPDTSVGPLGAIFGGQGRLFNPARISATNLPSVGGGGGGGYSQPAVAQAPAPAPANTVGTAGSTVVVTDTPAAITTPLAPVPAPVPGTQSSPNVPIVPVLPAPSPTPGGNDGGSSSSGGGAGTGSSGGTTPDTGSSSGGGGTATSSSGGTTPDTGSSSGGSGGTTPSSNGGGTTSSSGGTSPDTGSSSGGGSNNCSALDPSGATGLPGGGLNPLPGNCGTDGGSSGGSTSSSGGGSTDVPEPATFSLLGLGVLAMALRRRRLSAH
jgi:hypothetical protein